ncbi:MAG: glutathione S-transferase N-terminal domain-containing protein [Hyphomicrobiaceae bacterium]|nr:glutathione S-transferase N-terminal domain-containing protein [Hyphomicrobiaceae bacterium]
MITLYGMGSPNVAKVFIALEELGLPWELKLVDVFDGKQFEPEFLRLNPNAKVPVLIDPDGPGAKPITIFESGAILIYLAEKTGKLLPKDGAARYEAMQWLMVQLTGQGPMSGQLVHFIRFAPAGNDYARARYQTQVRNVYRALDQRLSSSPWLTGGEYGICDIAFYPWSRTAETLGFLGDEKAKLVNLARWMGAMAARPAVGRANAKQDETRAKVTAFDKANPDTLDRFLQRGRWHVGA